MKMNYADLIQKYKYLRQEDEKERITNERAKRDVDVLMDALTVAFLEHDSVHLHNFGTLSLKKQDVPERMRYNPGTKQNELCEAHSVIKTAFKPCPELKSLIMSF